MNSATPVNGLLELWRRIVFIMAVSNAENNWRRLAQQYGLSRSEIEGMAPAFDMRFKG